MISRLSLNQRSKHSVGNLLPTLCLLKAADELGMTQKQLNDYVNDPSWTKQWFELQNGSQNMGHRFEKPEIDDLEIIKRDMQDFLKTWSH